MVDRRMNQQQTRMGEALLMMLLEVWVAEVIFFFNELNMEKRDGCIIYLKKKQEKHFNYNDFITINFYCF